MAESRGGAVGAPQVRDGIAYRETLPLEPSDLAPVLCVHGFPESSYTWRGLLPAVAATGRRAIAPDLPGYGDSPADPPGTWERHVEAVERFRAAAAIERAILVVHDWGGLIGLRWACDHPDAVAGLVISNTGFFPDGEWHELGRSLRSPGQGETLIDSVSRGGLAALLGTLGHGADERVIDEYWKGFATEEGRRGMLELFRSGDMEKLEPYEGKLAELDVPTLVIWGDNEEYTPATAAERFALEIPRASVVMIDGAGHFLWDDEPERCAGEVIAFLDGAP